MSAVHQASADPASIFQFARLQVSDLDELLVIENAAYSHPWTRGNFLDSLYNGYETWVLRDGFGKLAGYFLLMLAVDEAHLLNITVRRDLYGNGVGRLQLDKAVEICRDNGMTSILLEVRPSNPRAVAVYARYGFVQIGRRKGYYPAANGGREDAIVMRFML
jgi:ribosomal-protein-alanine N-acetyltransferase